MKAAICTVYGPPEVLQLRDVTKPRPKANEVLVKIKAAGVNSADVRIRGLVVDGFMRFVMRLVLGMRKPRKSILGTTLSGVIEEVGEKVTKFKTGDEIFATTGLGLGAYAEYICLPETGTIAIKPVKSSFEQAVAILFGGLSALYFLRKAGIDKKLKQNVMIYGATGAVGSAAVQIAKHFQANVTSVCSEQGADLAYKLGSDSVIFYTNQDFIKLQQHFDIIFDAVGKLKKKDCQHLLKPNANYVTVGGLDVAKETQEQMQFLIGLYDKDELKAIIDKVYSLDNIVDAHRYVDTGKKKGNVIVRI